MDLTTAELNRCQAYTEALLLMRPLLPRGLAGHLELFQRQLAEERAERQRLVDRALATPRDFTVRRPEANSGPG